MMSDTTIKAVEGEGAFSLWKHLCYQGSATCNEDPLPILWLNITFQWENNCYLLLLPHRLCSYFLSFNWSVPNLNPWTFLNQIFSLFFFLRRGCQRAEWWSLTAHRCENTKNHSHLEVIENTILFYLLIWSNCSHMITTKLVGCQLWASEVQF